MSKTLLFKLLIVVFTLLLPTTRGYSQKLTEKPELESTFFSEDGIQIMTSVMTDNKHTVVTFKYLTTLDSSWISIDSKTYLKSNASNSHFDILHWGLLTDDDSNPLETFELNEKIALAKDEVYEFYICFPAIPEETTIIDIIEPLQSPEGEEIGFYWLGIQINNENTVDISGD